MSVSTDIAALGENENFVAFNAHWGFAFFVLTVAQHFHAPMDWVVGAAVVLAAAKEFYFDPKYETAPPQNVWPDGAMDFAGYMTGVGLALLI